jgi:thymidylate synthase
MKQYLDIMQNILDNGFSRGDRTGSGRRSTLGHQMRFDLSKNSMPIVTTRKIFTKGIIAELLWFIKGSSNIKELNELGVKFWDRWAVTEEAINTFIDLNRDKLEEDGIDADQIKAHLKNDEVIGEIGPIYGPNWRNAPASEDTNKFEINFSDIPKDKLQQYANDFAEEEMLKDISDTDEFRKYCMFRYTETVDQLNELVISLRDRPLSARHIVSAWVPGLLASETVSPQENVLAGRGALTPCHMMFQCFVIPGEEGKKSRLSMLIYVRSNDMAIGAPTNIAQYALLLHMLAHVTNMNPYELIYNTGDSHLYLNHLDIAQEQLKRDPLPLATVWLNPEVKSIFDFTANDIKINNYTSHDVLAYPISV